VDWNIIHIDETDSTNRWLRTFTEERPALNAQRPMVNAQCPMVNGQCPTAVWADYQTAGRGCGTNTWESERGKNLTFSVLLHPTDLPAARQFHISMAVSLALCRAMEQYIGDVSIKWPNDIYWRNGKIAGILIENRLKGSTIRDSIVGIGLNVNQRVFHSKAPNPVSLWQITEQEADRRQLLDEILANIAHYMDRDCREEYMQQLYRRKGFHPYADRQGAFMAELAGIEDDGHLLLHDDNGRERRYAFKEVTFI